MHVHRRSRRAAPRRPPEPVIEATEPLRAAPASHCLRCGGLMVVDHCLDLDDALQHGWCRILRCVQCGDMIDPVILAHRTPGLDAT